MHLHTLRKGNWMCVGDDRMVQSRQANYELDSLNRCRARQRVIGTGAFGPITFACGHDADKLCHCDCIHPQCREANIQLLEADRTHYAAMLEYYAAVDEMIDGDGDFQDDDVEPVWLAFDQPTNEQ